MTFQIVAGVAWLVGFALVLVFTAYACKRPAIVEVDEDDIREHVKSLMRSDARIRELEAKEARAVGETYYDVFRRLADAKENLN